MSTQTCLSLTARQHQQILESLYSEHNASGILLLCGRREGDRRRRLMVREVCPVAPGHSPQERVRDARLIRDRSVREGLILLTAQRAEESGAGTPDDGELTLVSETTTGNVTVHATGQVAGRICRADGVAGELASVSVVGDELQFWHPNATVEGVPDFAASHAQAFGRGTTERLRQLSVAVVGCSGSGSPVVEQLARLGVREMVLVDDDVIEERNVNRVLNSTMADANAGRLKVDVLADAIRRIGLGTEVVAIPRNIWTAEAVRQVAQCDVLFGCVDTVDARFLLNMVATYYTIPYFDIGIRLDAVPDGPEHGRIREVCGSVHYLQPGLSSLVSRGLFDLKDVRSAGLRRTAPDAAAKEADEGYISGVKERRPAVISVNMFAAALAVNDFLARLHPFREDPNSECAQIEFSLASTEFFPEKETGECPLMSRYVGRGDADPLLNLPELS